MRAQLFKIYQNILIEDEKLSLLDDDSDIDVGCFCFGKDKKIFLTQDDIERESVTRAERPGRMKSVFDRSTATS